MGPLERAFRAYLLWLNFIIKLTDFFIRNKLFFNIYLLVFIIFQYNRLI